MPQTTPDRPLHAVVAVLGDLGRSPRMQYHALALARAGARVDLLGYAGASLPDEVRNGGAIRIHRVARPPLAARPGLGRAALLVSAVWRATIQALQLAAALWRCTRGADVLVVQTPPALPTLPIAAAVCRMRRCRLVVDWHNFGYTLLRSRLPSPIVRIAERYERVAARAGDAHLCVSGAMQRMLTDHWGLAGVHVLRDRPLHRLEPLAPQRKAALIDRLWPCEVAPHSSTALVVTSSSWTPDEDMSLLLRAAELYDGIEPRAELPRLLLVATGDGPLRAAFQREAARLSLRSCRIVTGWLPTAEYRELMAAADLGVCLHTSSSGVDLPMKVSDMFGAGTPVCALDYGPCLRELVDDDVNGRFFTTAEQLCALLAELLRGFPESPALHALRAGVRRSQDVCWIEGWEREARAAICGR